MAIYTKKNSDKIALCTTRIEPGCFLGDKIYKIIACLEKPRIFYVSELMADGAPEEIASVLGPIAHPEKASSPSVRPNAMPFSMP